MKKLIFCKKNLINSRQTNEMRVAVEALEAGSTEKSINDMAGRHFEEQSLLQGYWGSRIDALRLDQRRQYRNWIMRMLEEQQTSMIPTPVYVFFSYFDFNQYSNKTLKIILK